jgi:hypothetical protein
MKWTHGILAACRSMFLQRVTGSNSISELTHSVVLMPTTRSYTKAEASRMTLMIQARRAQSTSTISKNSPFRHHNLPPNPNIAPPTNPVSPPQCPPIPARRCGAYPPRGNIEELPEEPPEHPGDPSDPGDDDGRGDSGDDDDPEPDPDGADPIPNLT